MPEDPTTIAELLERIASSRTALAHVLAGLPDDRITTPGTDGGWSIKDHLGHLNAWEAGIAALLRREPRYAAMHIDRDTYFKPEDDLNAVIQRHYAGMSLEAVRAALAAGQQALDDALAPLTDDDLMNKTYSYYQPDEPGNDSGAPIMDWVIGNSGDHYAEHLSWIEALIR